MSCVSTKTCVRGIFCTTERVNVKGEASFDQRPETQIGNIFAINPFSIVSVRPGDPTKVKISCPVMMSLTVNLMMGVGCFFILRCG